MQYLSAIEVADLATEVANNIQLQIPPQTQITKMLELRDSLPQFYSDGTLQLWVDKYYIAHSSIDEPDVHYVYLTTRHINEERYSYRQARNARKNQVTIPKNIEDQFSESLKSMDSEKKFVIFEKSAASGSKFLHTTIYKVV